MAEFRFPDVAEGIHEGKLIAWKVKEGDLVEQDQALCEMETDKSVLEIPSPQKGVIQKLHYASGQMVPVGEVLVTFTGNETPIRQRLTCYTYKYYEAYQYFFSSQKIWPWLYRQKQKNWQSNCS